MTETETTIDAAVTEAPGPVHCRHCGQTYSGDVPEDGDFLCPSCEHYQDTMTCSTCGSVVRISLMPEGSAPQAHAPARARKSRGEE